VPPLPVLPGSLAVGVGVWESVPFRAVADGVTDGSFEVLVIELSVVVVTAEVDSVPLSVSVAPTRVVEGRETVMSTP